jgi:hypothetical protein
MVERRHGNRRLSRRGFLAATSTAALTATLTGLLPGCGGSGGGGGTPPVVASTVLWRRSTEGRRASRAAKAHAANRLYATELAALSDPAHPGDNAKVVPLDTTRENYLALFGDGSTMVDLRRM